MKVQNFVRKYREKMKMNSIQSIKQLVKANLYRENIPVNQYFFLVFNSMKMGSLYSVSVNVKKIIQIKK